VNQTVVYSNVTFGTVTAYSSYVNITGGISASKILPAALLDLAANSTLLSSQVQFNTSYDWTVYAAGYQSGDPTTIQFATIPDDNTIITNAARLRFVNLAQNLTAYTITVCCLLTFLLTALRLPSLHASCNAVC
jgi:hypothetical protein